MTCVRAARFTRTALLLALTALLPAGVEAAPCPTTTVADLLTIGTCSIGDKIFSFTDYRKGLFGNGRGVDASMITFTPSTTSANGPGFRLSSSAFNITNDFIGEELLFTVTVCSPGQLMSGFSVAMNNPSLGMGGSTKEQFETARLGLALVSPTPATSTSAGFDEACNFVTGCATGPTQTPPVVVSPAVSVMALSLSIQHFISGTGSFDSVDAFIQQTPDPVSYTYSAINHPDAPNSTSVYGINNLGRIVGSYTPPLFVGVARGPVPDLVPAPRTHGFVFDSGIFTPIDAPSGADTAVRGINDAGTMVGYSGLFSFGASSGFVDESGQFTSVAVGSSLTRVNGINNSGVIVGSWEDRTTNPFTSHGFFASNPAGPFPTLDFPGALTTELTGVNDQGAATGTYATQVGPPVFGFIVLGGQFSPTGPFVTINSINDSFAYAGSFTIDGVSHGFVVSGATIRVVDVPGATGTTVYGINNAGTLVGTYVDSEGTHGFVASPPGM